MVCISVLFYSHVIQGNERDVQVIEQQPHHPKLNFDTGAGGNNTLYVSMDAADTYDSIDAAGAAGTLNEGELFFVSDDEQATRSERLATYPADNVRQYAMQSIQTYENGEAAKTFVAHTLTEHLTNGEADRTNINHSETKFGSRNYATLTDHIYLTLRHFGGCDFTQTCSVGNFEYRNDGMLGTTLLHEAEYYDIDGERIGTLEAGTKLYSSYDYQITTGNDNKDMARFVGHRASDSSDTTFGTIYVDMFTADNKTTFATTR
ncbi:hypothetical protein [Jeotgalicoccus halotolerans]|uniref:hypothetical protein n=1 Tax=Jeotgalicoccus halotolerans TaxID=157227 RepID=UPI0011C06F95|nr:hypothetical protein [Jeotgalicoccus halotolerans]